MAGLWRGKEKGFALEAELSPDRFRGAVLHLGWGMVCGYR